MRSTREAILTIALIAVSGMATELWLTGERLYVAAAEPDTGWYVGEHNDTGFAVNGTEVFRKYGNGAYQMTCPVDRFAYSLVGDNVVAFCRQEKTK